MIKFKTWQDGNHTTQRFARTLPEAFPGHLDYNLYEVKQKEDEELVFTLILVAIGIIALALFVYLP
jgi:hypothetical protein